MFSRVCLSISCSERIMENLFETFCYPWASIYNKEVAYGMNWEGRCNYQISVTPLKRYFQIIAGSDVLR